MHTSGRLALGAVGAVAAGLGYAYAESKMFTLRRVTVPVLPATTAGAKPIRVLHLSDLHLSPEQARKLTWLRSLSALQPDLVVNTGDNLAHRDAVTPLLDALGDLLDTPGVFVNGSNDYFAPVLKNPVRYLLPDARLAEPLQVDLPWEQMVAGFEASGWHNLNNRRAQVTLRDGRQLTFVGTDDAHLDRDKFPPSACRTRPEPVGPDVPVQADDCHPAHNGPCHPARGEAESQDLPALLHLGVTHAPYLRVLSAFQADGVQLALAGHTHGGQLRVPGFGALVTNCDLDRRRAAGLSGWPGARPDSPLGRDSLWLHVSAGAGTSPYTPVRFACRPSATLLTLTPREYLG